MTEVTLGFDELEYNDLPRVCMVCGARRDVDFVPRRFLWRPIFAPGIFMLLTTRRATADIPLCPQHGGPRLFATQRFTWWGLKTVAIEADRLTLGRVAEEFADALHDWREKGGGRGEFGPPPPRRRVQVGRGPGGGGAALKGIGIVVAVMAAFVVAGVVGMVCLMALGMLALSRPRAPAPPPPTAVVPAAQAQAQPEGVVVGLLAAAPVAGVPGALPWAPLALAAQKSTFHLLEDAELTRALADLRSQDPNAVEAAAKRLAAATPEPARRREAAEALTAATANPFVTARQAAAEGLAVWGDADDVPALARMLNDPFPNAKTAAVAALAGLKDPRAAAAALPELEKAAHDRNPTVARAAADAVQAMKARQNLEEKHP